MSVLDLGWTTWAADPLCAQTDPETFFPTKGGSTRMAKKVCGSCPVSADCLEYALHHDVAGVWGGTSYNQRRRLRDEQGITASRVGLYVSDDTQQGQVVDLHQRGVAVEDIAAHLSVSIDAVRQHLLRYRNAA